VNDIKVRELSAAREMKKFEKSDYQRAIEMESLGATKKKECACCYQIFSAVNLPLKVSTKAVVDMRKKWSGNAQTGWWVKIDKKLSDLSRCYDDVGVCLFCAQFFHDQDSYRPPFETIYYEERKKAHLEQKRLEKEYWDPLKKSEQARAESELLHASMVLSEEPSFQEAEWQNQNSNDDDGDSLDGTGFNKARSKQRAGSFEAFPD
jgi:hypothetical protein